MTIEALKYIDDTLNNAGINYEFGMWTSDVIYPYFVGEYTDTTTVNEDGMKETTFLLSGTSRNSMLELEEAKEKIEDLFPSVGGRIAKLDNGSRIVIFFNSAMYVPTDTADIKRLQINLTIKEWKVK